MKRHKRDKKDYKRQQEEKNKNDYDCSQTYTGIKSYQIRKYRHLKNYRFSTNPVVRERSSRLIQFWWRNNIKTKLDFLKKIITIQKIYRGYFIRKYIKDIIYLTAVYEGFCSKVSSVMSHCVRRLYFPRSNYKKKKIMLRLFNVKKWQYFRKWRYIILIENEREESSKQMMKFRKNTRKRLQLMKSYFDIWKLQVTSEQIKEQHSKKVSDLHRKTDGIHKIIDGTNTCASRIGLDTISHKLNKELHNKYTNNQTNNLLRMHSKNYKMFNLKEAFMKWKKQANNIKYNEIKNKLIKNTVKHYTRKNTDQDVKSTINKLRGNMLKDMADKIRKNEKNVIYPYGIKHLRNYIRKKVFSDLFQSYAELYRKNKKLKKINSAHNRKYQQEKYVSLSRYLLKWYYNTIIINKNNYTDLLKNLNKSCDFLQSYLTNHFLIEPYERIANCTLNTRGKINRLMKRLLNKNDKRNLLDVMYKWKQKALNNKILTLKGKFTYKTYKNIENDKMKEILTKKFLIWKIFSKINKKIPKDLIDIALKHINQILVDPYIMEGLSSIKSKSDGIAKQRATSKMFTRRSAVDKKMFFEAFQKWKSTNVKIKKKVFVKKMCDSTKNKLLTKYFEKWKKYSTKIPIILNNIKEGSDNLKHYLYLINTDCLDAIKYHKNINYLLSNLKKTLLHVIRNIDRKNIAKYFNKWKNIITKIELIDLKKRIQLNTILSSNKKRSKDIVEYYFNHWRDNSVVYNKNFICNGLNLKDTALRNKQFYIKGISLKNCILRQYFNYWLSLKEISKEKNIILNKIKNVIQKVEKKDKRLGTKHCFEHWKSVVNKSNKDDVRNLYVKSLITHKNKKDIDEIIKTFMNLWKEKGNIGKVNTESLLHTNRNIKRLINALKKEPSRVVFGKLLDYRRKKTLYQLINEKEPIIQKNQIKRYSFDKWKQHNNEVQEAKDQLVKMAVRYFKIKPNVIKINKDFIDKIKEIFSIIDEKKKESAKSIGDFIKGIGKIQAQIKIIKRNLLLKKIYENKEKKLILQKNRNIKHWKKNTDIKKINEKAIKIQKAFRKQKQIGEKKKEFPNKLKKVILNQIRNRFKFFNNQCNQYKGVLTKEKLLNHKLNGFIKSIDKSKNDVVQKFFNKWKNNSLKLTENKCAQKIQSKYRQLLSKIKAKKLQNRKIFFVKKINDLEKDLNLYLLTQITKWKNNSKLMKLNESAIIIQHFLREHQKLKSISKGISKVDTYFINEQKRKLLDALINKNKTQKIKKIVIHKNIPQKSKNTLLKKYFEKFKQQTLAHPSSQATKIQSCIRRYIVRKKVKKNETELIKIKLLTKSCQKKKSTYDEILKKCFNHWLKNMMTEKLKDPTLLLQKHIRGYLYRKNKGQEIQNEVSESTKKLIRIKKKQLAIAPVINKYTHPLNKSFIKWKYGALNDKLMKCWKIKNKQLCDDKDLVAIWYHKWKNDNKKSYLNEQSRIIQHFLRPKMKKILLNKAIQNREIMAKKNVQKIMLSKLNNIVKALNEDMLKNENEKGKSATSKNLNSFTDKINSVIKNKNLQNFLENFINKSLIKKRNDLLSKFILKYGLKDTNLSKFYFIKFLHQGKLSQMKDNAIIIANFFHNKCAQVKAKSKWQKLYLKTLNANVSKDLNIIALAYNKMMIQKGKRKVMDRIYKLYIYKKLNKQFEKILGIYGLINKQQFMNNFSSFKIERNQYSYSKPNGAFEHFPLSTHFSYKSLKKSKEEFLPQMDRKLVLILPHLVKYLTQMKNKRIQDVLCNMSSNYLEKKFIYLYKKFNSKRLRPIKFALLSNLKHKYSKNKFYRFCKIHILHKIKEVSKETKYSLDLFYLIRLAFMHKKIARAIFTTKVIRTWNRYVQYLKVKNWQLDELEKNFAETYERLADDLFGNKVANPGIPKQVQDFIEKVNN